MIPPVLVQPTVYKIKKLEEAAKAHKGYRSIAEEDDL
jgi:hypothetical protein